MICQLVFYNLALRGDVDDVLGKGSGVVDAHHEHGSRGVFFGLDYANDTEVLALAYKTAHVVFVVLLVHPNPVLGVIGVIIAGVHQLEGDP